MLYPNLDPESIEKLLDLILKELEICRNQGINTNIQFIQDRLEQIQTNIEIYEQYTSKYKNE